MPRRRPKAAPTIDDVADIVGVSRSTVSRAYSRPELLSKETVDVIHKAAARLGYSPNQVARALSTGKHGNLAIVVPDIANAFFPPLIRAAQLAADSRGKSLFLGDSNEDPQRELTLLGRLMVQTEGIVLASSRMKDAQIQEIATKHPIVLINRDVTGIARVLIDTASGVDLAVRRLHELGHRRIAYVGGPSNSWSEQQRRGAIRKASARLGMNIQFPSSGLATFDAGQQAAEAIVASKVSAAIAFDDVVAHGILAGLISRGIRVPDDISVVGCDDVLAARTYPALTSVSSRHIEAGRLAVEILSGIIESGTPSDARIVLDTKLVERSTTSAAASTRRPSGKLRA